MGSHPYFYFTDYQPDANAALQALRQREFEAGRYDPALNLHDPALGMFLFPFPPTPESIAPGPGHDSIAEAIEDSDESGTGSILDIEQVSDSPGFSIACPVPEETLAALFGTVRPSREAIERVILGGDNGIASGFHDLIGRGECRYLVVYHHGRPSEIFFIGYSID
jgi:hypothetical protein